MSQVVGIKNYSEHMVISKLDRVQSSKEGLAVLVRIFCFRIFSFVVGYLARCR